MAKSFLEDLPDKGMDKSKAHEETFKVTEAGTMISLGVFVGQEIERFNKLLNSMRKSLSDLVKAIDGTVVMSIDLETMYSNFTDNKVPIVWSEKGVGYPSLKPLGSWIKDIILRFEFMSDWLYNGPPKSFWLPAFFFPQGFMTATLQTYARQTLTAIDTLTMKVNVTPNWIDDIKEKPEVGVNIHGLYVVGAKWDFKKKVVEDQDPNEVIVQFPVIWLEPILEDDLKSDRQADIPLYKTSVRAGELSTTGHSTNFIRFMQLPSEVPADYWIRRGAALLCMTDT